MTEPIASTTHPPGAAMLAIPAERDGLGRPTARLRLGQLLAINAYWLAISTLWGALGLVVMANLVDRVIGREHPMAQLAVGFLTFAGVLVAIVVQPTIGAISDNTRSRFGRRKPWIVWGTIGDVCFLALGAWAFMNASRGEPVWYFVFAFSVVLLQFSSNIAQGPYQGYVPDLVPSSQVGVASGLFGAANLVGNLAGAAIAITFLSPAVNFPLGIFLVVGAVELVTMLITVLRVPDAPGPPTDRTVRQRARAAWGTDILEQRDYVWLLVSRLFVLMGMTTLSTSGILMLANYFGLSESQAEGQFFPILLVFGIVALLSAVPGGWLSGRYGRKPVIYGGIAFGVVSALGIALSGDYTTIVLLAAPMGVCYGVFAAVDWALMTDIIPKAESGRYMGLSNVVTGGAQAIAPLVAGIIVLVIASVAEPALAYRAVFVAIVIEFALGAWALRSVREPRAAGRAAKPEAATAT